MITLFRKIRQSLIESSSTRKYLLYAIGEIALVVLGILIALQINNWNEENKRRQGEKEIVENLIMNLGRDSMLFSNYRRNVISRMELQNDLFEVIVNKNLDVALANPSSIRSGVAYYPVTPSHNQNVADQISNDEARDAILRYFNIEKRVKGASEELKAVAVQRMRTYLLNKEAHNLSNWYNREDIGSAAIITREDIVSLTTDPEFQQLLLELSIKSQEYKSQLEDILEYNDFLRDYLSKAY